MKINLTFKQEDFKDLRAFEKAVKRQIGDRVYIGTNSLCLYFDYPRELCAMLRPKEDEAYIKHEEQVKLRAQEQLSFDLESTTPN